MAMQQEIRDLNAHDESLSEQLRDWGHSFNPAVDINNQLERKRRRYDPQLRTILQQYDSSPADLDAILDRLAQAAIDASQPPLTTTVPVVILNRQHLRQAWSHYKQAVLDWAQNQ
jgi:hypothetical protein